MAALSGALCEAQDEKGVSAAEAAATRLGSLITLDLSDIRFFAGDNPEASSVDFDDSHWKALGTDKEWNEKYGWLRLRIVVPEQIHSYEIRGARLSLSISLKGTRPVRYFLDGLPLNAGNEREPILLTEHATPGRSLLVAAYVVGDDEPRQTHYAKLIAGAFNRPDPAMLGQELQVAEAMLRGIEPQDTAMAGQLSAAISAIDFNALERHDQTAFDQSLAKSQQALEPLKSWMQHYSIHVAGNSHIDMAWLWPWTETVDVVHRTFSSALQLLREFPDLTYTHSSAQAYEWMEEKYPDLFEEIRQRVREGRWEVIGGMWVEPDLNMPDGESQVRQLLLGTRYFKKKFGVDIRTGWNPDSFGYNWQLPQIYKKSGIDYFLTQKLTWNDTTQFPYKLFWWEAPDGSRVLTYFPHGYNNVIDPVKMARDLAAYAPSTKAPEMLYLFGVGDHGGGPTRTMLQTAERWRTQTVYPWLSLGAVQPYFDGLAKQTSLADVPVWRDELYLEFHRGVYTTQAETKKGNRRSEELLLTTEKFSSFASLLGAPYPKDDLRNAWKKVLFNQFHDIASGSGIPAVAKDAAKDYAEVRRTGEQHLQNAIVQILTDVNTAGAGQAIAVMNPLSWKRTELVEAKVRLPLAITSVHVFDSKGQSTPAEIVSKQQPSQIAIRFLAQDIPSLGYEVYRVVASAEADKRAPLKADSAVIEDEFVRVRVDSKTGCITSLWDKASHWESVAAGGCANQLQAFADNPEEYDAWNIDADFEKQQWNVDAADEVKLVEDSPLRAVVRVRKHFQKSAFEQDITVSAGVPRVDVMMRVDWHEQHILLKTAFPVAVRSGSGKATYEIPYGSIARPTSRNTPEERAKFEVPALRWADLSDDAHGLSLLNDSKYGYDCKDNVLRLTLLRSPTWPDPLADQGHHEFTYSFFPHAGPRAAATVKRGYELNSRLIAVETATHPGKLPARYSFLAIEPENLTVTAVKESEDGNDLIVRFYESEGKKTTARLRLPPEVTAVSEANLMERDGEEPALNDDMVSVETGPYEIKTVRLRIRPGASAP